MNKIILIALCMTCISCALVPKQEYHGAKKPKSEIAIIKGYHGEFFIEEFWAKVSAYSEIQNETLGNSKSVGNNFVGYPREIHLLPGHYLVQMYCFDGAYYSTPSVAVETKAGYTYILKCEAVPHEPNEQSMVRVIVHSIKKSL